MYKERINIFFVLPIRMVGYLLWLIKEITKSSIDISLKMWKLDPEISPEVLWVPVKFKDDVGFAIYANSITLTPGTVTIGTKKGMVYVHSLTEAYMEQLKTGNMVNRVYKIMQSGEK
jgi:multicomponent Na+:H+ antiporter subunit E